MTRIARVAIPDVVYHITQRGNNRQDVFFVEDDRRVYLELLAEESDRYALRVLGYCLMTNHIHLVAVPQTKHSLAKAVGRTHWRYTRYVNGLHRRSGHLWQNRFFSCGLDEKHTVAAMRYVEQNPVRAKIVRKPWRYAWSSSAAHV
ncbi:MAG: transposase, partial [Planctomycetes bacterium DG_58]